MKRALLLSLVSILCVTFMVPLVFSQDAVSKKPKSVLSVDSTATDPELAAIRAQSEAFVEAIKKRDAKAVAALWTKDGEYIDDAGRRFAGRDEIEKGYEEFFANNPEAQMRIAIESIRLLSGDSAIEDGSAVVEPSPAGGSGISKYTVVHVKVGGQWLMASVRDKWIETPVAVRSAADIEWLVGTWIAEDRGVQTESICRWAIDDRFLERKYTTTQVNGSKTSGMQLIGWNPQGGFVQSWDFSHDGGHAVGIWNATDDGWQAEVRGTTGDGTPTSAVNLLRRLDDNAYVWRSVQRVLGETRLSDTDEIVIKRNQQKSDK